MPKLKAAGLSRRQMLKVGGVATFAGYAVGVEKALGQAIKTDTQGIVAGDARVAIGSYQMPVYEARPANATSAPIVIVISEIWGVHEWVKDVTRRFAKDGYYAVRDRAVPAGRRRRPHPERAGHPEDRAGGAAQAGARRRRGRGGLGQEAARRPRGPGGRDRPLLGRLHRVSDRGDQPRHQGGGGVGMARRPWPYPATPRTR